MKKTIIIFSAFLVLSNTVLAKSKCDSLYPQLPSGDEVELDLPFDKKAVSIGDDERGLCISYMLKQSTPQKIICVFSNLNEGWILYKDNNVTHETSVYSGNKTVIFTNKGRTGPISDQIDQYHIDENGLIAIHHFRDYEHDENYAIASCSYIADEE